MEGLPVLKEVGMREHPPVHVEHHGVRRSGTLHQLVQRTKQSVLILAMDRAQDRGVPGIGAQHRNPSLRGFIGDHPLDRLPGERGHQHDRCRKGRQEQQKELAPDSHWKVFRAARSASGERRSPQAAAALTLMLRSLESG